MKCTSCGSRIPEGKLYCPFCGEEVQLVPEYLSADMQREKLRLEKEEEKRIRRERELAALARQKENRMSPLQRTICAVLGAVFGAFMLYGAFTAFQKYDMSNYGYLKNMAIRAADEGDLDTAMRFIREADKVMPESSVDMALMEADILHRQNDTEGALRVLCTALTRSTSIDVYRLLISYLEEEKRYREAAQLVSESGLPELAEMYPYLKVSPPDLSLLDGATYSYGTILSISSDESGGSIYYTTDGTAADESGLLYTEPIMPEVGTNRISAVCVNDMGIMSEEVSVSFKIRRAETKSS